MLRAVRVLSSTKNTTMKFHSSAITAAATALVGSTACLTQAWTTNTGVPAVHSRRPTITTSTPYASFTSTALYSTGVSTPAEQEAVSSSSRGDTIAEGAVVSLFPGGMSAVRINDDWTDALERTKLNPKDPKATRTNVAGDLQGRNVVFPNGTKGVVVCHRPPLVFVYSDQETLDLDDTTTDDGGHVKILDGMAKISTHSGSSVVDCFGNNVGDDDAADAATDDANTTLERAMFAPIPQVKDIALINNPMLTGITMVDALAPIGRGQNMLMVGSDVKEMRGFAVDFLQTQAFNKNTKCIYAAVDDSGDVVERLRQAGIADMVHVVEPTDGTTDKSEVSKAAEAVAIAGSACAIGEAYALQKGVNAVVVVDTIDLHKKLWDATTRVLVDVFGVDAVVKGDRDGGASSEMRAFYSSLIQRAGQFKVNRGGGSVTLLLLTSVPREYADMDAVFTEEDFADSSDKVRERIQLLASKKIPLTAATLQKIDIPIPSASEGQRRLVLQHMDELISMSDGQIWLDERLEAAGQRPPMDPQRSVTRIGIGADTESRADAPALRRVVEGLRLALSQAANMQGAEVNKSSIAQLQKQNSLLLAMHQPGGAGGRKLSESCVVLLAASNGLLDETVKQGHSAGTEEGQGVIDGLLEHVRTAAPAVVAEIDQTLDMTPEARKELLSAMESYFESS